MPQGNSPENDVESAAAIRGPLKSSTKDLDVAGHAHSHALAAGLMFAVLSLVLLLVGIGRPATMFFDEGYFVPEARALIQGVPNPAPYVSSLAKPPMGKILMAMGIKIAGDNPFGWRFAGAVCGAFTVVAVYLWTFLLTRAWGSASLAAGLALLNNFLFVMSRVATVDVFLVFFLTWSLVAFTASIALDVGHVLRRVLLCVSGVLIGLAGACKWNAIDTLAVYLLVALFLLWRSRAAAVGAFGEIFGYAQSIRQIGIPVLFIALLVAPVLSYGLAFWPICRLLHLPFTPREIAAINAFMWRFNRTTAVNPFITMPWYSWPLNLKPQLALSYLVGNPVTTWGGLLALGLCLRRLWKTITLSEGLVSLLFAANYLQWSVTPQKGLYYYYYYPCVIILGVAVAVALRILPARVFGTRISMLVAVAAAIFFARSYPQMAHLEAPWDCVFGCGP